jgi:hypothetical protein
MKTCTVTVNVIKNFNGITGTLVEKITRVPIRHSGRTKTRSRGYSPYTTVSYGGKQFKVFTLPESYGELAGLSISI